MWGKNNGRDKKKGEAKQWTQRTKNRRDYEKIKNYRGTGQNGITIV